MIKLYITHTQTNKQTDRQTLTDPGPVITHLALRSQPPLTAAIQESSAVYV